MVWCWIPLKTGINLSCVCSAGGRLCSLVKYRINVYFLKRSLRGPDGFCSVSLRVKAQTAAFVQQWISPSSFAIPLTVAETITHTHTHAVNGRPRNSESIRTGSRGRGALQCDQKKQLYYSKGLTISAVGEGCQLWAFLKGVGFNPSDRSLRFPWSFIKRVRAALVYLSSLANVNQCVWERKRPVELS